VQQELSSSWDRRPFGHNRHRPKIGGLCPVLGRAGHTNSPQFSDNVRCGQTVGWTKMPLGMEVGLGPGDFVFDGEPAPPFPPDKTAQPAPIFGPCLLWPNGWMDEDATWYGSRSRPRPHCVRRGPSSPHERGTTASLFSAQLYCGHGRPSQLLLSSCDPSNRLATIHQRYSQTDRTGQTGLMHRANRFTNGRPNTA